MAKKQSMQLLERIRHEKLRSKIMNTEDTISFFENGMYLGFSGFSEGHPKLVPSVLADYVEKNGLAGKMRFNVYTGASIGSDVDDRWSNLGMLDRRWPQQQGLYVQRAVNAAEVNFGDRHLSMDAQDFGYGFYTLENRGEIDLAIIEASGITEDGGIVPADPAGVLRPRYAGVHRQWQRP